MPCVDAQPLNYKKIRQKEVGMDAEYKSTHIDHHVDILRYFLFFDIFQLALILTETKAGGLVWVPPRTDLQISISVQEVYWGGDPRKQGEEMGKQNIEEKPIKLMITSTVLVSYCCVTNYPQI